MAHIQNKLKLEIAPIRPWVTLGVVLLCLWCLSEVSNNGLGWLRAHGINGADCFRFLKTHAWSKLAYYGFWSTFCQMNIWHFLANAYFIWVFGSTVEIRLGNARFLAIILGSILIDVLCLVFDMGRSNHHYFIGPSLLTCSILGSYMVFFPEKKIDPAGSFQRTTTGYFRNAPPRDPVSSFGVSPWILITCFVAYQFAMNLFILKAATKFPTQYELVRALPAAEAFVAGFALSLLMIMLTTGAVEGNPLQKLSLIRYRQLRNLDMTHDEAVVGAARLLSVPVDQVRAWIGKNAGAIEGQGAR